MKHCDDMSSRPRQSTSRAHYIHFDSDYIFRALYYHKARDHQQYQPATGETWEYLFYHTNKLTKVERRPNATSPVDKRVEYGYDVFGNRIRRTVDADGDGAGSPVTEKFAYEAMDGEIGAVGDLDMSQWNAWADLDDVGNVTMRRLYQKAVDAVFARIDDLGNPAWYLTDNLGSVRDLIDNSANLLDHLDYTPFGQIATETNPTTGDRYKYTSREWDTETQLQYNRARYYDPTTRRWISQDPLGFDAGDGNLYRYVNNCAVINLDPAGLAVTITGITVSNVGPDPVKNTTIFRNATIGPEERSGDFYYGFHYRISARVEGNETILHAKQIKQYIITAMRIQDPFGQEAYLIRDAKTQGDRMELTRDRRRYDQVLRILKNPNNLQIGQMSFDVDVLKSRRNNEPESEHGKDWLRSHDFPGFHSNLPHVSAPAWPGERVVEIDAMWGILLVAEGTKGAPVFAKFTIAMSGKAIPNKNQEANSLSRGPNELGRPYDLSWGFLRTRTNPKLPHTWKG